MANPVCTRASLVANSVCFRSFNAQERAALLIYLNSRELAALGGTNYTLTSGGTLEAAAVCLKYLPGQKFRSPSIYELLIASNSAVAAGAVFASTQTALAAAIACNKNFPEDDLMAQMLQLLCDLGVHKAYPQ